MLYMYIKELPKLGFSVMVHHFICIHAVRNATFRIEPRERLHIRAYQTAALRVLIPAPSLSPMIIGLEWSDPISYILI